MAIDLNPFAVVEPIGTVNKKGSFKTTGTSALVACIAGYVVFINDVLNYFTGNFLGTVVPEQDMASFVKAISKYKPASFADAKAKLELYWFNKGITRLITDEEACIFLAIIQNIVDSDGKKVFNVDSTGAVTVVGRVTGVHALKTTDTLASEGDGGEPSITITEVHEDGRLKYEYENLTSGIYILQRSTDVANWENLSESELSGSSTVEYTDDDAVSLNYYYRVVSLDGTLVSGVLQDYYGDANGLGAGLI